MSVPYTDSEASEARQWSNRYGPPNAWTASLGTAARMIGRLLDERERLIAKQTVAAPGDDYIREWHEEFQRWKAVAEEKQDFRDYFAAAALTGLLASREWPIDSDEAAHYCYRVADAMLRERCRAGADCPASDNAPSHDAAPEATAESDEDRTDKAATSHRRDGTGDTPATHATRGDGSERREGTEPVAWAVMHPNDEVGVIAFNRCRAEAYATASDRVVPLYRHPPCQDFSQKNLTLTDAEREAVAWAANHLDNCGWGSATLRGLLERLGGGR